MPETAYLSDPLSLFRIEYSRPVMERIRGQACDGLMALPRIGMGVGGLLLGVREEGVIRVLDSIEIHCSHANGPPFLLTGDEKDRARELIAGAGVPGVVGWYCSKPRGATVLNDADLAFYNDLLPDREHVSLVLRPSTVEPTRAVFYFRGEQGRVVKGIECELEEWRKEPVAAPTGEEATEPEPEPAAIAKPEAAEPIAVPVAEPVAEPIAEVPKPAPPPTPVKIAPAPVRNAAAPEFDMFAFTGKPPARKNKLPLWGGGAAILVVIAIAAWFTQDSWIPRPALNLNSTETGGDIVIRWNAAAFRGIDHTSLFVNDDGELKTLPLDRFTLTQGVYHYAHGPKSQRVTAKLAAGEESSIAIWLAPAPPAPPTPAAPAPAAPDADSSAPPAATPAPDTGKK